MQINRRQAIKSMAAFGAMTVFSNKEIFGKDVNKPIHFIGLGGAGCNMLEYIQKQGIVARYTCITNPVRNNLSSEINVLKFDSPRNYTLIENWHKQNLKLPMSIKLLLHSNSQYVILSGFGGYTGTMLTKSILKHLKKQRKDAMAICCLPFKFETPRKSVANETAANLNEYNNITYLDLDIVSKGYGQISLKQFFDKVNEDAYRIYKSS
jgi:cell division GTPase FtsZ